MMPLHFIHMLKLRLYEYDIILIKMYKYIFILNLFIINAFSRDVSNFASHRSSHQIEDCGGGDAHIIFEPRLGKQ